MVKYIRYIHTVKSYSAIKKNLLIQTETWKDSQRIMRSGKCQSQKVAYFMIPFIQRPCDGKIIENKIMVSGGKGALEAGGSGHD